MPEYKAKARLIKESDYDNTLVKWWTDWRWNAPSKDFLPRTGFIVSYDGVDVCACYIYDTDSRVAWLEWIISNFEVKDREIRKECMEYMIVFAKVYMHSIGKKYVMSMAMNPSLINTLKENGFQEGTKGSTELIMLL
jgi:hypothetical protein